MARKFKLNGNGEWMPHKKVNKPKRLTPKEVLSVNNEVEAPKEHITAKDEVSATSNKDKGRKKKKIEDQVV